MRRRCSILRAVPVVAVGLLVTWVGCDRRGQSAAAQPAGPDPPPSAVRGRAGAGVDLVLAASVFPIADLVGKVAGDRWRVVTLLPPGCSPHGYSLRPAEAGALARARILFAVEDGLDGWAIRAARGINSRCKVVVLTEALGLKEQGNREQATATTEAQTHIHTDAETDKQQESVVGQQEGGYGREDHSNGHHEGIVADTHRGMDPHIWLDPVLARRIAELAAVELTREDPDGRGVYRQNLSSLKQQLAALDDEYRRALASCEARTLVVFHPGYGYLARRYGLEQLAVVAGDTANPGQIQRIIDAIRSQRIRAVYREPQFDSKWVDFISRQTGAQVLVLDPLGHASKEGYDSYFAMMRSNLAALKEGLGCG